jgi:hypothetical protein
MRIKIPRMPNGGKWKEHPLVLTIELSPDLERRLTEEAARQGQSADQFARAILEERLSRPEEPDSLRERTADEILGDFFAQCPPSAPEELAALAREQGVDPAPSVERLMGAGPADEDEFDVDAFLVARRQWQWEGRPPGVALADPEDARQ